MVAGAAVRICAPASAYLPASVLTFPFYKSSLGWVHPLACSPQLLPLTPHPSPPTHRPAPVKLTFHTSGLRLGSVLAEAWGADPPITNNTATFAGEAMPAAGDTEGWDTEGWAGVGGGGVGWRWWCVWVRLGMWVMRHASSHAAMRRLAAGSVPNQVVLVPEYVGIWLHTNSLRDSLASAGRVGTASHLPPSAVFHPRRPGSRPVPGPSPKSLLGCDKGFPHPQVLTRLQAAWTTCGPPTTGSHWQRWSCHMAGTAGRRRLPTLRPYTACRPCPTSSSRPTTWRWAHGWRCGRRRGEGGLVGGQAAAAGREWLAGVGPRRRRLPRGGQGTAMLQGWPPRHAVWHCTAAVHIARRQDSLDAPISATANLKHLRTAKGLWAAGRAHADCFPIRTHRQRCPLRQRLGHHFLQIAALCAAPLAAQALEPEAQATYTWLSSPRDRCACVAAQQQCNPPCDVPGSLPRAAGLTETARARWATCAPRARMPLASRAGRRRRQQANPARLRPQPCRQGECSLLWCSECFLWCIASSPPGRLAGEEEARTACAAGRGWPPARAPAGRTPGTAPAVGPSAARPPARCAAIAASRSGTRRSGTCTRLARRWAQEVRVAWTGAGEKLCVWWPPLGGACARSGAGEQACVLGQREVYCWGSRGVLVGTREGCIPGQGTACRTALLWSRGGVQEPPRCRVLSWRVSQGLMQLTLAEAFQARLGVGQQRPAAYLGRLARVGVPVRLKWCPDAGTPLIGKLAGSQPRALCFNHHSRPMTGHPTSDSSRPTQLPLLAPAVLQGSRWSSW